MAVSYKTRSRVLILDGLQDPSIRAEWSLLHSIVSLLLSSIHQFQYICFALLEPNCMETYRLSMLSNGDAFIHLFTSDIMADRQWYIQYIPRNMHTVFALLCFVVVIHWLIFPYPSGLLHWHWGNLTIAPVPAKQPWWIWINISCGFIMNDCITTTKQSTTEPCAYFLGYTVPYCYNPDAMCYSWRHTFTR